MSRWHWSRASPITRKGFMGRLPAGSPWTRSYTSTVVLQIIDAPASEGVGVLTLVLVTAGVAAATVGAGRGIRSQFQPLAVDIVGQGLHVGKAAIALDFALGVARGGPGVVDVDVLEAVGGEAELDHGVGGGPHLFVRDHAGPDRATSSSPSAASTPACAARPRWSDFRGRFPAGFSP